MYLEIQKSEVKYNQFLDILYKLSLIMFANDLIKPKGKEMTGITLVTGFLSKDDEVPMAFAGVKKIKRGREKCLSCF